jgi:hypothetical protein
VPLPTSQDPFQNLTSVDALVKDVEQLSLRVDQRLFDDDYAFARFSSFDANEEQPFGTSSLQETLVPGFGRLLGRARATLYSTTAACSASRCFTSFGSAGSM